ncbi:MAG: Stress response protein nst1 [Sclerophora amabilis]|nr:MAG: Stress response protein nst1 [Sclerophora amabilis]
MPSHQTQSQHDPNIESHVQGTATYSNKDGSKFITVRKSSAESASHLSDCENQQTPGAPRADMGVGTKPSNGLDNAQSPASPAAMSTNSTSNAGGVNRKKQKRRQKQAARLAAEHEYNGDPAQHGDVGRDARLQDAGLASPAPLAPSRDLGYVDEDFDDPDQFEPVEGEDLYYSDEEGQLFRGPYDPGNATPNGHSVPSFLSEGNSSKRSRKKKKNKIAAPSQQSNPAHYPGDSSTSLSTPSASFAPPPPPPPPPLSAPLNRPSHSISRDRIWNTSTQEERERIKEFWLSLGEEDRRSLVKVEKEAVLRKMKEQQKHSCSCTVCGRKRTAIEEELEVLYDAYYEELEQYANHQQVRLEDGTPTMPPPGKFGPIGRLQPPERIPPLMHARHSRSRIQELPEDEDDGEDEEYSDEEEEDEEEYSDEEPEEPPQGPAADFFNFGNSLTVQGGILTVADDLLKNDGKKFIEMMEQLAERRMQREEEAQYAASGLGHPSMNLAGQHLHAGHNHPPHPDDEEYDEEEDEDYDSQEDEEYDDDEMESMTEEQRMEEGRRMFQIFAARMFEQRVLTAYREKVAQERQQKLLEELEEESRLDTQREQKKAKEAQKKKDKKRLQKQAKDEEKARKDAEKAAEEAEARATEERKAEEQRLRKEEQRKKREAEKKAQEEERTRKEAEKQKRLQDERDRQLELERKQREQKEREKRKREEVKKKEREEREAKERAVREKREKDEKERNERDAKAKSEKEAKERAKKEEQIAQQATAQAAQAAQVAAQASRRPSQLPSIPAPPGLASPHHPSGIQSPHLPIAAPAVPKAPTPIIRQRQASQQGSVASSPKTPQIAPPSKQSTSPNNVVVNQQSPGPIGPPGRHHGTQPPQVQQPQPPVSHPATIGPPPGVGNPPSSGFPGMPSMSTNGVPFGQPSVTPRGSVSHDGPGLPHQQPPIGSQHRGFPPANGMSFQQPQNTMRPMPLGRGAPGDAAHVMPQQMSHPSASIPSATTSYSGPRDTMPSHSRHHSASYEGADFKQLPQTQPISRPAPIQRPSSTVRQGGEENGQRSRSDIDDLSRHLGSSALLDDTDEPFPPSVPGERHGSVSQKLPSAPGRSRLGFGSSSMFPNAMPQSKGEGRGLGGAATAGDNWGATQMPFGPSGIPGSSTWSQNPGAGWSNNNAFGVIGGPNRPTASRALTTRLLVCQACKQLTASNPNSGNGFHDINTVHRQVDQLRSQNEPPIQMREMLDICDTEGDSHNGGGFFTIRNDGPGRTLVRHELGGGNRATSGRGATAPGEIGSPMAGSSLPTFGGARPFQQSSSNAMSSSSFH